MPSKETVQTSIIFVSHLSSETSSRCNPLPCVSLAFCHMPPFIFALSTLRLSLAFASAVCHDYVCCLSCPHGRWFSPSVLQLQSLLSMLPLPFSFTANFVAASPWYSLFCCSAQLYCCCAGKIYAYGSTSCVRMVLHPYQQATRDLDANTHYIY